jgi:alanyl-tRNA synthetase
VVDAVTGGIADGALHLGADLPVRTGTEGWTFVVAHIVGVAPPPEGTDVNVEVDAELRRRLSAGHTACHLASLALDAALAGAWRKPVASDALGAPAFDALAIQRSQIVPDGSVDTYRIGKSLRRKGFEPAALDDLPSVEESANALLADWVASGAPVRIERDAEGLSDRRAWVSELPDHTVVIPCGGTHASSLADFATIAVALRAEPVEGGIELVMTTTAIPAD